MSKSYTKRSTEAARENLNAFKKEMGDAVYKFMIDRCTNPKSANWKNYGGRGIVVCDEWKRNPDAFYLFAMTHGWKKGLQLDRIDNDKGYYPWNCRFVTAKVNCRNTRANVPVGIYDASGNLLTTANTISEAAEMTNTAVGTVHDSINKVIGVASGKYRFCRLVGEVLPGWVISCMGKSVKVTNRETGEERWFKNEHQAAKHYHVNHVTIRHWCMGMKVCKAEDADNLTFEYIPFSVWLTERPGASVQLELDLYSDSKSRPASGRFSFRRIVESVRAPIRKMLTGKNR